MALLDGVGFTTTTTGTGTITVAAGITDATNSDLLTPAQAGAVDGATYSYIIVNGHNREEGSGVTGSSGTTLTRDAAAKSWNGTTLGTGPLTLAGTSKVYFVARGGDITMPPSGRFQIAQETSQDIVSGRYYSAAINGSGSSTFAGVANRWELQPFVSANDFTAIRIGVEVTTGVASATGKLHVYASGADGWPSTLLVAETADLDFSTSGFKEATISQAITKGTRYWLGIRHSSTATLRTHTVGALPALGLTSSTATSTSNKLIRTLTYATAATTPYVFTTSDLATAAVARILLGA